MRRSWAQFSAVSAVSGPSVVSAVSVIQHPIVIGYVCTVYANNKKKLGIKIAFYAYAIEC
jgi:hypothetical protein